jgi:hypothetical protein
MKVLLDVGEPGAGAVVVAAVVDGETARIKKRLVTRVSSLWLALPTSDIRVLPYERPTVCLSEVCSGHRGNWAPQGDLLHTTLLNRPGYSGGSRP